MKGTAEAWAVVGMKGGEDFVSSRHTHGKYPPKRAGTGAAKKHPDAPRDYQHTEYGTGGSESARWSTPPTTVRVLLSTPMGGLYLAPGY